MPPALRPCVPVGPPQFVQHVTGYQHCLSPPLFGFSLPMSTLLHLRDGPSGTKLICKQVGAQCWLHLSRLPAVQHGGAQTLPGWKGCDGAPVACLIAACCIQPRPLSFAAGRLSLF